MAKNKAGPSVGEELLESMQEALAHARGEKTGARVTTFDEPALEVKRIRERVGFTQDQFAAVLGISASGLRKWEQNQRTPRGAAFTLLRIMEREPAAVARALADAVTARPGEATKRASARIRTRG